jgi:hypothetical protein
MGSFVFNGQGCIKINVGIIYQCLDTVAQSGINAAQVFGMGGQVAS